jgi:lysophospholipase L1-like esterase
MKESICIFGDSTAWGVFDTERGGWANRLHLHIMEKLLASDDYYAELYNCSISGGTTETILARFENEAKIRNCDALIFQTGGNDSAYLDEPGKHWIAPEQFEKNIAEIIFRAKKITTNIIFTDLRNCDETKTFPVPWAKVYYSNENMKRYGEIVEKICKEHQVLFLDIKDLRKTDFADGLHPTSEGHRVIFEQVRDYLIEQKWIP